MKNWLSEDSITEYMEAFDIFDKNGDGKITPAELEDVIKSLGMNPIDAFLQAKWMIKEVDQNGDGTVDFADFCSMMERKNKKADPKIEIRNAFHVFDKDGNNFISPDELRNAMATLKIVLTDVEFNALIKAADTDGDGQLDYEEFEMLMMA